MQTSVKENGVDRQTTGFDEHLRSISAIIAARNDQTRPPEALSKKHMFRQISIKEGQQENRRPFDKPAPFLPQPKIHLIRPSKIVPVHNVFYFDEGSDLTTTDFVSKRVGSHRKRRQGKRVLISKRRRRFIGFLGCLLTTLILGIIVAIVLVAVLIPSKINGEQH